MKTERERKAIFLLIITWTARRAASTAAAAAAAGAAVAAEGAAASALVDSWDCGTCSSCVGARRSCSDCLAGSCASGSTEDRQDRRSPSEEAGTSAPSGR